VGDGPLRDGVERAAAQTDRVHVLGSRGDVARVMAAADLLLLPSLTEGVPGVILEAGAQSLPVVAYQVGGVGEAVLDGTTGRLIPVGEETTFADVVSDLLGDRQRRHSMGAAARTFIESEYALARSVDAFEDLYSRIIRS
ncbi:MAG: glycosyltransferase, partial [Halobacteriales archaeon]|nr:glycosyltransferase [Halobacteriales archaeon]